MFIRTFFALFFFALISPQSTFAQGAKNLDENIEDLYNAVPHLRQIVEDYPHERKWVEEKLTKAFKTNDSVLANAAAFEASSALAGKYRKEYFRYTSDEGILAFLDNQLLGTHELSESNPVGCFNWAFIGSNVSFSDNFNTKAVKQLQTFFKKQQSKGRLLTQEEFDQISGELGAMIAPHFKENRLNFDTFSMNPHEMSDDLKAEGCYAWWSYLAGIKLLPFDQSAAYFRTLMIK